MIPECYEPRGLHPSVPPKDDTVKQWEFRRSAIIGSHSLASAILRAHGLTPPPTPTLPPHPKRRKRVRKAKPPAPAVCPSAANIVAVVGEHYDLEPDTILSRNNKWCVSHPRQVAFYLMRTVAGKSLSEIGRRIGGFDHTTVLYGVRAIERKLQYDGDLIADVEALKARLTA